VVVGGAGNEVVGLEVAGSVVRRESPTLAKMRASRMESLNGNMVIGVILSGGCFTPRILKLEKTVE